MKVRIEEVCFTDPVIEEIELAELPAQGDRLVIRGFTYQVLRRVFTIDEKRGGIAGCVVEVTRPDRKPERRWREKD